MEAEVSSFRGNQQRWSSARSYDRSARNFLENRLEGSVGAKLEITKIIKLTNAGKASCSSDELPELIGMSVAFSLLHRAGAGEFSHAEATPGNCSRRQGQGQVMPPK